MKLVRWIVAIALMLVAGYMGLILLAQLDLVTDKYATLSDARADQLFERGWLPDILPASAHNIRTTNDLDVNTSRGEFHFMPAHYPGFASRLRPYVSKSSPFADLDGHVQKMTRRGQHAGVFTDDASTWLFLCDGGAGHCEYTSWVPQE